MNARTSLLALLAAVAAAFAVHWTRRLGAQDAPARPGAAALAIGALTNFFDTLGIGSFAPTTALIRTLGLLPDRLIPGTLNVGHALPSVAQALVFIAIVRVEARTLVLMIAAAVAGAWLGAGAVARWPRRRIQAGMGGALLVAAAFLLRQLLIGMPAGADRTALEGGRLLAGVAGNLVLGALMTIGIGLYAPCMILVTMLGMNAVAAFPIMMGSCAFLMPAAGLRFMRADAYAAPVAVGLTVGGVPAVAVAAFLVRSLPLGAVRVLVLAVAVLTATSMLRAACGPDDPRPAAADPAVSARPRATRRARRAGAHRPRG